MTLQEIQYKAQAIMQKWRDEDSAPYIEFVEELALMTVPEEPDKSLEEEIKRYIPRDQCPVPDFMEAVARHFAEWQKEQMPMPEDTVLFNKGVQEGRRLEREDIMKIITKDDNLEEAAENIYKVPFGTRAEDFITGAEWQKEIDRSYFLKCYEQGKKDMKVQVLKEAVGGYVGKDGILTLSNGEAVDLSPSLDKIAFGLQPRQKVRIVVLKEEEE